MSSAVGERIGQFIDYLGLTHAKVAGEIGVRRSTVSDWVRGAATPDTDNLVALAGLGSDPRDCLRWLGGGGPIPLEMVNHPVAGRSTAREVSPHAPAVARAPQPAVWERPIAMGDQFTEPSPGGIAPAPQHLLDMIGAAKKIADAIGQDLVKSEVPVLLDGATELGRQRALVWALKDLARQLHHLGFDMRNLFEVTDGMAREIGLPVRSSAPTAEGDR